MQKPWLKHYPEGVDAEINPQRYPSVAALFERAFQDFAPRSAYVFLGRSFSYAQVDQCSRALAAYFQSLGLVRGDRVALMMPNIPQYPMAVAAVLRAGLVVVNVNPLYTPRELAYQLQDCGAKAIVILENFAAVLQKCQDQVPVQHVVLAAMGDRLGPLKGTLVNGVIRHIKKLVPRFELSGDVCRFNDAIARGLQQSLSPVDLTGDDVAVLQYTGGTTGTSKGVVLLHRNLVANTLQARAWYTPSLAKIPQTEQVVMVCALPVYHIFSFTVNMLLGLEVGACLPMVPNPRDLPALFKVLRSHRFHVFAAVNTLFNAMAHHPQVDTVDWSSLVLALGGGTTVQPATAKLWLQNTETPIIEGYGLSEASPVVTCNPTNSTAYTGTIGLPLPSTDIVILDDEGQPVSYGQPGELCVKGPQVMAGYWQRPDETAQVMTSEGFLRTGDVAIMEEGGTVRIVDRKKDMISVSGFKVYPNEIEDVITQLDGVLECAVIGVPDERTGEAVKVFVVKENPGLTEAQVRAHCEANLTGYKRPRTVEFRPDLPKTPVGKVLRKELRHLEAPASV